jgi:hypothetical protein
MNTQRDSVFFQTHKMRLPLELQHLIKTASPDPKPRTPSAQLLAVEEARALEVEHYLRACALRLNLV